MKLPITFREITYGAVVHTPNGHRLVAVSFGRSYVLLKAENDTIGGIQVGTVEFDKMGFLCEVA